MTTPFTTYAFLAADSVGLLLSGTVKILPLGDSITQGHNATYGSYRRELYSLLTGQGISVDFVGPFSDGTFADPDHAGYTGEDIVSIWARVATFGLLSTYAPDLILLMIGTNNIWGNAQDGPTALGYYNSLLDSIAVARPGVKTIVASIPPIDVSVAGPTVSANVDVFNAGLPGLVASKGSNFFFVDINVGLTTTDLADGVHPTDAGNDKMAALWYPTILGTAGPTTPRTMPDRLADIRNVKDFGAFGDGVHDDWAAIDAACNWNPDGNSGTIFFPPGTYLVSQSINLLGRTFNITGVIGASIITGNFGQYVLKRDDPVGSTANTSTIENLTIINQHATGGGIRMGLCSVGAIRNCSVTANQGISNAIDDTVSPLSSLDFSIENCDVSPGSNVSGSTGIMSVADGPILNCRIIGFEAGIRLWGNEGGMSVRGCYLEQNVVGIDWGTKPDGLAGTGCSGSVSGCWFKDNGTAIKFVTGIGGGFFSGILIEASEAVTIGGSRPQYGIQIDGGHVSTSLFTGIIVTGQYDRYGIYLGDTANYNVLRNEFVGVRSFNTSTHGGLAWRMPTTAGVARFIECNQTQISTVGNLPILQGGISAASWIAGVAWELSVTSPGSGYVDGFYSNVPLTGGTGTGAVLAQVAVGGGQVVFINGEFVLPNNPIYPPSGTGYTTGDTLSISAASLGGSGSGFSATLTVAQDTATATTSSLNLSPLNSIGSTLNVIIEGVTPTQYNGVYTLGRAFGSNTFMYGPVSNPGGNLTVAGTVAINLVDAGAPPGVLEGELYNVSDSTSSTWGAETTGGGSTHALVRWGTGSTNWTVVGI